jgi:mannose-6-phosphate isomerase-like protein (cupin superfamily)
MIVKSDKVNFVEPNTNPTYDINNPLERILDHVESFELAAERNYYEAASLQYLVPFSDLELYGPQQPNSNLLDAADHNFKTDFQKQNIADFTLTDTHLIRGYVSVGDWTGPFLRISYSAGPQTNLAQANFGLLGDTIKAYIQLNDMPGAILEVPYNDRAGRYELEIWGYNQANLYNLVDGKAKAALERGELIVRSDLLQGQKSDFIRDGKDGAYMGSISKNHAMHPILPLHVQIAWANYAQTAWDSLHGANYHYEFNMLLRGWDNYLGAGVSPNPHGGVGFLEFRNLMSNYFYPEHPNELGRELQDYNWNAYDHKNHEHVPNRFEEFLSVNFIDMHIMRPFCGIGIHRHRDNSEIFMMLEGQGLMLMGDWVKMPTRERCFEIRTLKAGHYTMLKPGNLHALMNTRDEDAKLFMFGSYD